jgi:hypothetical protein
VTPRVRLERRVNELLAAARRGEASPTRLELLVVGHICVEEGALDAVHAIRQYLRERSSGCGAHTSRSYDDGSGVSRAG